MALLFLVFTIAILLMAFNMRKAALIVAVINLLLILAMFWHHVTDVLKISL